MFRKIDDVGHSQNSPVCNVGHQTTELASRAEKFRHTLNFRFRAASCVVSEHSRSNATVHSVVDPALLLPLSASSEA